MRYNHVSTNVILIEIPCIIVPVLNECEYVI